MILGSRTSSVSSPVRASAYIASRSLAAADDILAPSDAPKHIDPVPGLVHCITCNALVAPPHAKHDATPPLTAAQLARPTALLRPLAHDKSNAQYFFAPGVVEFVAGTLARLQMRAALCVGMPSLHEALAASQRKSMLLDLDARFAPFFPRSYAKFNMFNGHFFFADQARAARSLFPTVDAIVVDPPFGGLVEALAATLRALWRDCLAGRDAALSMRPRDEIPTLLFFPYFLEAIPALTPTRLTSAAGQGGRKPPELPHVRLQGGLQQPPDVQGSSNVVPRCRFTRQQAGKSKRGSPVRIFTNIAPRHFALPEPDYRRAAHYV